MKKIVVGFILGVVTSLSFTVFAVNSDIFTAQKASFEVFVDGKRFESENPPLVVEGRTYLPLRATGEVLGVEVKWNHDLKRVEINKGTDDNKGVDNDMPKPTDANNNTEAKSGEIFREVQEKGSTICVKEINGEQYATPSIFADCIYSDEGKSYIKIPGKDPVLVKVGDELTEHATRDKISGILVKLSSLRLEAEVNGGIIIIKYK